MNTLLELPGGISVCWENIKINFKIIPAPPKHFGHKLSRNLPVVCSAAGRWVSTHDTVNVHNPWLNHLEDPVASLDNVVCMNGW